jgi:serine/threonine-protein kinase
MGTPGYSPPEAIREGRYTPQADVFAWGAVMYELMSGRIPYEGPDTKTTNGYVVQGNAPPPTRHDPSIPEPLASVAMTALQPSDKSRFKDASEAEQALREAWERCLTQGLVHPAVLAMDEVPHDKAPVRMHEPRGIARPSPSISYPALGDSQEVTAINDNPPKPSQLVVAATRGRPGDDDPTKLMIREEGSIKSSAKLDVTFKGVGPSAPRVIVDSAADTKSDPAAVQRAVAKAPPANQTNRVLVIALVIVLALAAAAVGLYFGGLLR